MTTQEAVNEIGYHGVVYARQSNKPEWYDHLKEDGYLVYCATSGSSPHNEWYAAKTEEGMYDFIFDAFNIEKLTQQLVEIRGKFYHFDDVREMPEGCWTGDELEYELVHGAEPVSISEIVWAESSF